MPIFSINNDLKKRLSRIASERLNSKLIAVEPLGGWNNLVLKLNCNGGKPFLVKKYYSNKDDNRDRIGVEFNSLKFLWSHGIRNIPEPIFADFKNKIGIYSFIDGERLKLSEIDKEKILQTILLLAKIKDLSHTVIAGDLPVASEACFSIKDYIDNLLMRYNRLEKVALNNEDDRLLNFLKEQFLPLLENALEHLKSELKRYSMSYEEKLEFSEWTLSPSDVGFHNILKDRDDKIFLIDFEYFGWDDPVKMVCDILHQPDLPIPDEYRTFYLKNILKQLGANQRFIRRLKIIYPLLGLKWSLIILNDFLPGVIMKRRFAKRVKKDHLSHQLEKAEKKLEKVMEEGQSFPKLLTKVAL